MIKLGLLWLFSILTVPVARGQQEVLPGLIPRFYGIEAAVDLPVPAADAHERAMAGQDISTLDPSDRTNIWNPHTKAIPRVQLLRNQETVRFVRELPSRAGQVRFTVLTADNRELVVVLSKKIHNQLLRRNLLAKLGYVTHPMSWVPRLKIEFVDSVDRDLFKIELKDQLLAGSERWVLAENGLTLDLQDVLVQASEPSVYNLATGVMPAEVHQGRRLLRAPYVPLALVDTTESVNLFPWQAGRIVLNHVKLNHTQELDTSYRTSWEDARWIGRRIGRLTRVDWSEVVELASFPPAVEKLLLEKIIARRNDLMSLLKLEEGAPALPFDPAVRFGNDLVDGEVVKEFFPGWVSRFSYGDPESPFSASELGSFALSRGQSQLVDVAVSQLNRLLGTQDQANFQEAVEDIIKNQGVLFPTQAVAIPTFHGSLILSRDIVTGAYLGTNNKVQLVDNVGFSLDAGVVGAIVGLPIPLDVRGGGRISFQRVYSHVKPVQSLKKSLKEPFKNMYIPMLLQNLGQRIDRLNGLESAQAEAEVASVVAGLKEALAVGESFIITDSLVPALFGEAELSVSSLMGMDKRLLRVYGRVQTERMLLTRFHFHRATEDTFHVYQDYGKNLKLMLTMKLRSFVPILGFNGRWNTATAETHFYPVSLASRDITTGTLKALRQSIFSLNHDALKEVVTPHRIGHEIKGDANTLQFLMFKRNRIGTDQSLALTHAVGGEARSITRRYDAITTGTDSEGYVVEAVNQLILELAQSDFAISQVQTINPGFTLNGRAKNKVFTTESDGQRVTTTYQRIFNGWRVTTRKLRDIIGQLNKEAGRPIFDPLTVRNTNSILLYQVSFNYTMTQEGVDRLLALTPERVVQLMERHPVGRLRDDALEVAQRLGHRLTRLRRDVRAADPSDGLKDYHSWLRELQDHVTVRGLEEVVGNENIAYQGRIEGFRQGDEGGDGPLFTHVFGELPLPLHTTPTQRVMQNWGILEGELLANWLTERAI